jgi:hypothetical protein
MLVIKIKNKHVKSPNTTKSNTNDRKLLMIVYDEKQKGVDII